MESDRKKIQLIIGILTCLAASVLSHQEIATQTMSDEKAASLNQNIGSRITTFTHESSQWIFTQVVKSLKK